MASIEEFLDDNKTMRVDVVPGVSYNMRDVIDEAYTLYNGMFQTGNIEDNGFQRIFMRKMWVVYRTLIQGSDVDLKNLNVRAINGIKVRLVALLKMLFISHLEREEFGVIMDRILSQMAWFGSSIVKRFDDTVDVVDLRTYTTEANQPDPQLRQHLFDVPYTYSEIKINKKEWDNFDQVEMLWEAMQKQGISGFVVSEFWTFDEEGKKICKKYVKNDIDDQRDPIYIPVDEFPTPYKLTRTKKSEIKKYGKIEERFPVEQFDFFDMPGRTFGLGCAELLGGPQEYYNELFSNKRKLDLKALMGITVHNAVKGEDGLSELSQDFLANLSTGTVTTLAPGETLTQLDVNTYSFDFDLIEQKIYELMRQIIGVTSQGTGEEAPASTSATQASINQQVANTVFDYTRERMHHGLKRLFNKGYSQDIINSMDEKEVISIVGDASQLEEFDKMLVDNAMNDWAERFKNAMGMYPSEEEYMQIREEIQVALEQQGDTRFPQFKKSLIKDMEFLLTFEIQQESFDTKLRSDALIAMKNDPESTKSKTKIEDELLTLQGLNPKQYDKTPQEKEREAMMQQQAQMQQQQAINPPQPAM